MKIPASIGMQTKPEGTVPLAKGDAVKMAKQIETVFLTEFLKSMFEQTSFAKNKTISAFLPVITGHMADSLAGRGLGFSELLMKNHTMRQELPPAPIEVPAKNVPHSGMLPSDGGRISSRFGIRIDPFSGKMRQHNGIDIAVPENTPVRPAAPGKVVFSGFSNGYGNCVIVDHGDGVTSLYGHNVRNLVKVGDTIAAGTALALSGSTGRATGPHIHFELRKDGTPIDPAALAPRVG
jgi:murein DD-endopeptidase MepM/ murein hydrolase activator NlpD